jgi:Ca-activated chloride channel family protein
MNDFSKERMQNKDILRNFAEKSGGRFFTALGGLSLKLALESVVKELGTQYTLGYAPSNNKKDGKYRKIELKVTNPKAIVRTRKGYHASKK